MSSSTPAVAAADDAANNSNTADDAANNSSTAEDKESVDASSSAPAMVNQETKINIMPELADPSANAFTQMVLLSFPCVCKCYCGWFSWLLT